MSKSASEDLKQAVAWLDDADGLLIVAGAGMASDTGIDDHRDRKGLWRAHPAIGRAGLRADEIGSPDSFRDAPRLSWGFFGQLLNVYRQAEPHAGYGILRGWGEALAHGAFVYTDRTDGSFAKAGFAPHRIVEARGSLHRMQCLKACTPSYWSAADFHPSVDDATGRLSGAVPSCPYCGAVARPNIAMFNDWNWVADHAMRQQAALGRWLARLKRLVVVEVGVGSAATTVRDVSDMHGPRLIRIHPTDFHVPSDIGLGFRASAIDGLQRIEECRRPMLMVGT